MNRRDMLFILLGAAALLILIDSDGISYETGAIR